VLSDPGYKQRASAIQADYARNDGPAKSVDLLEKLAVTRQPIMK
jgi:UDP:flavonoid glycosyltransferase YjiC (YdhE family)